MSADQAALNSQADGLYERYGKPLEIDHQGEYVAIFPDGRIVLGSGPAEVLDKAVDTVGLGSFVFRLGERAVWRWR